MGRKNIALTIAGSDPTGGAGLQADIKVFQALQVYGISVASVLTAQNTEGVHTIHELAPEIIYNQLDVLLKDLRPDALKTGMLYTGEAVRIVSEKIKEYKLKNLVIDPVTVSSTGVLLLKSDVLEMIKSELFPLAKVITPNIYEASVLTGITIDGENDMKEAAVRLAAIGPESVIITGGHLEGKAADIMYDGQDFTVIENEKMEGEYHGTGCVFSAALTASLARGYDLNESFHKAKEFISAAIASASDPGIGMKMLGI